MAGLAIAGMAGMVMLAPMLGGIGLLYLVINVSYSW
jgi:hypothetical protein